MANVTLSIVIPVYKAAKTIVRCLDSVFSQLDARTSGRVEVLVVNDCSPDNAEQVLSDYALREPRVRLFAHDVNQGAVAAHNTGMDHATGEYVMRLDADDALRPGAIERWLAVIDECHPDIIFHCYAKVDPDGKYLSRLNLPRNGLVDIATSDSEEIRDLYFEAAFGFMSPNSVFRIGVDPEIRQDPRFPISEDRYYGWQFFRKARTVYFLNEIQVDYYQYGNSLSHQVSERGVAGLVELHSRFWTEFQAHPRYAVGARHVLRRLMPGYLIWHFDLVFNSGPVKPDLANAYFATLKTLMSRGVAWRVLPFGCLILKCAARLKSPTIVRMYRCLFVGCFWKIRNRLARIAKTFREVRI